MTTENINKFKQARAKMRKSSNSWAPPEKQINYLIFRGEGVRFDEKDTQKVNGTVFGYSVHPVTGEKEYIDIQIKPEIAKKELEKRGNAKRFSGGLIDENLETWFPHTVTLPTGEVEEENSILLEHDKYYTKNVDTVINQIYPENLENKELLLYAQNPELIDTYSDTLDNGEEIKVKVYQVRWINKFSMGSQLMNNIHEDAVFSLTQKRIVFKNGNESKIAGSQINNVIVWENVAPHKIRVTTFSDTEGLKKAFKPFEEAERLRKHFLTENIRNKAFTEFFNKVKQGAAIGFEPVALFGIKVPMEDSDFDNKYAEGFKEKILYLSPYHIGLRSKIAYKKDTDGNPIYDSDGYLEFEYTDDDNFVYETYTDPKTGEERNIYTFVDQAILKHEMKLFQSDVLTDTEYVHKALKAAYPDLDLNSLTEDNFFIITGKQYRAGMIMEGEKERSAFKNVINQLEGIYLSTVMSTAQKEEAWNDIIYDTYENNPYRYSIMKNVTFLEWNGNNSEVIAENQKWQLKAALTSYPVVDMEDCIYNAFGTHRMYKGLVEGGSLNENNDTIYAYATAKTILPYSFTSGGHLGNVLFVTDGTTDTTDEKSLFVPKNMNYNSKTPYYKQRESNPEDDVNQDDATETSSPTTDEQVTPVSKQTSSKLARPEPVEDLNDDIPFNGLNGEDDDDIPF